jgi:hypothetical protein
VVELVVTRDLKSLAQLGVQVRVLSPVLHTMDMDKKLFNMAKGSNRQKAIDDGFYDGRFRPKVVLDKKVKEQRKSKKHKNRSFDDMEG